MNIQVYFVVLCSALLYFLQIEGKALPSTSKKITTHFTAEACFIGVVWSQTHSIWGRLVLSKIKSGRGVRTGDITRE